MPTTSPPAVTSGPPNCRVGRGDRTGSGWSTAACLRGTDIRGASPTRCPTTPTARCPTDSRRPRLRRRPPDRLSNGALLPGGHREWSWPAARRCCVPMTVASDRDRRTPPSLRSALATTWRLVRMIPLSTITTPVHPVAAARAWTAAFTRLRLGPSPITRTTDGRDRLEGLARHGRHLRGLERMQHRGVDVLLRQGAARSVRRRDAGDRQREQCAGNQKQGAPWRSPRRLSHALCAAGRNCCSGSCGGVVGRFVRDEAAASRLFRLARETTGGLL